MDNTSKILGGLLIVALIYIVFLEGCGGSGGSGVIITSDTVYIETNTTDTIIVPVAKIVLKYIETKIPVPYLDTTSELAISDSFDDFVSERPMIYQDTISDDSIMIHYKIRTWGFIDKIDIGYSVLNRYYIKERSVLEKIVTKEKIRRFQGIYVGLDVNISDTALTHPTPILELSMRKVNYNIGYDFKDKAIRAGIRVKLGK